MLKIQSIKVGESSTNCYLIWAARSKESIIVDPGDSADYVERIIADLSLRPTNIVLTHGHWDHTLAALELSLAYKVPILINKADTFLFKGGKKMVENVIKLGEDEIKIIETPGHTPGSISLYSRTSKFVLVGDICFADGTFGRTDFGYSDSKLLVKSLKKIKKLAVSTAIYPGHGEAFKVAKLTIG